MKRLGSLAVFVTIMALYFSSLALASSRPSHPEQEGSPSPTPSGATVTDGCEAFNACPTPTPTEPCCLTPIRMEVDRSRVTFGETFWFSGSLTSSVPGCVDARGVKFSLRVVGESTAHRVGFATTQPDGTFGRGFSGEQSGQWFSETLPRDGCESQMSQPVPVLVRGLVQLKIARTDAKDFRVSLLATLDPCHFGTNMALYSGRGRKLSLDRRRTMGPACEVRFVRHARGRTIFQARWGKYDEDHEAGRSPRVVVDLRR